VYERNKFLVGSSTATSLVVNSQGNVGIGTASPSYPLQVYSLGINSSSQVVPGAAAGSNDVSSGVWRVSSLLTGNNNQDLTLQSGRNYSNDTGNHSAVGISISIAPDSGAYYYNTLALTPSVNQTGTASGITRGLYINPTLTSAVDWRAIEVTKGNVLFGTTSGRFGVATSTPWRSDLWDYGTAIATSTIITGTTTIGASNTLVVNTNEGKVGIGTASPKMLLHVAGSVAQTAIRLGYNITEPNYFAEFDHKGDAGGGLNIDSVSAANTDSAGILFRRSINSGTSYTESMRIDKAGNVGIGNVNPQYSLDIAGSLNLNATSTAFLNGKLAVSTSTPWRSDLWDYGTAIATSTIITGTTTIGSSNTLVVNTNERRVGIGTTTPAYNLDIYQASPASNQILLNVSTSGGANKFTVDEDGDVLANGMFNVNSYNTRLAENYVRLYGIGGAQIWADLSGNISMGPGNGDGSFRTNFSIMGAGNVGIGTTTPLVCYQSTANRLTPDHCLWWHLPRLMG